MIRPLGLNKLVSANATNSLIISTLVKMMPVANKQYSGVFKYSFLDLKSLLYNAQNLTNFFRIKYKPDTFENQNIQLPSSLINTRSGDCKSFALLVAAFLQLQKTRNGLVFVSYKPDRVPTHVYNFFENNGVTYYIDNTLPANRIQENRKKETYQIQFYNV
jgi:predicted transglutaminase-like protease